MVIEKDDWRLQCQEKYLQGITLYWKTYTRYSETWDHAHCEFCWAEFCLEGCSASLLEGYATEDNYRWICRTCFDDFKEMFNLQIGDLDKNGSAK